MNRYPLWKYIIIVVCIALSALYTLPNFFGETPAVQVSSNRQSIPINESTINTVQVALQKAGLKDQGTFIAGGSLKVRFDNAENQLKARDVIEKALGDGYIIALNLIPDSPEWMAKIGANPMFLGLDLRGGVHFTLEVDMEAALSKTLERYSGDVRRQMRQDKIRIGNIQRTQNSLTIPFQDVASRDKAVLSLKKILPEVTFASQGEMQLLLSLSPELIQKIQSDAVKQNMNTLSNRVNELGVAEPVIQQSGATRIVVQLPGIQDTAKAKDILGRTATLELRMVNDDPTQVNQALNGNAPEGFELLYEAGQRRTPVLVSKQVELTGDNLTDAQPSFDEQNMPSVSLRLDSTGSAIFADLTKNNVNKRMAMVLIDQDKAEVITAPVIRQAITGGQVSISGSMNAAEANDTALLLRAGSLAAPMKIVEERTIGPSLGQENISKGFHATLWGFVAVGLFMLMYYRVFGVFSVLSMCTNVLLLIGILSALQATLTLPGIAAIALTLGMAIDANVLINERIREELRDGLPPQKAIAKGYDHAWATIVDSNITSLIAGLALLIFGSGAVRGFAVVHCIGILTSMFSSVFVSRAIANLWYGRRRHLEAVSIGSVWRPDADTVAEKE